MADESTLLMGQPPIEPDPMMVPAEQKGVGKFNPPVPADADPLVVGGIQTGVMDTGGAPQINRVPKSEIFRTLLADFLRNVGAGMAAAGTGPGANVRGAGAAIGAQEERELTRANMNFREQQLETQRQQAKSLAESRTAETKRKGEMVEFDDPVTGQTFRVPITQLATLIRGAQAGKTAVTTTGQKTESAEKIANSRIAAEADLKKAQTELANIRAQAAKAGMDPNSPQFKLKQREVEARIALAQANLGLRRESMELAQARHALSQTRLTMPTAPTRTMMESAPKVLNFVNRIRPLVEQEAGGLGPVGGRWSEFMAGKLGAPNPEYTKLRTNIGLLDTMLMRMHVGARGGQQLLEHFKSLMDQGKQSPENLLASLEVIEEYANDLKGMGTSAPQTDVRAFSKSAWKKANPGGNAEQAAAAARAQGFKVVD